MGPWTQLSFSKWDCSWGPYQAGRNVSQWSTGTVSEGVFSLESLRYRKESTPDPFFVSWAIALAVYLVPYHLHSRSSPTTTIIHRTFTQTPVGHGLTSRPLLCDILCRVIIEYISYNMPKRETKEFWGVPSSSIEWTSWTHLRLRSDLRLAPLRSYRLL